MTTSSSSMYVCGYAAPFQTKFEEVASQRSLKIFQRHTEETCIFDSVFSKIIYFWSNHQPTQKLEALSSLFLLH